MNKIFCDISFYEGDTDFHKMKSRADYVILKSSQAYYRDPKFEEFRRGCVEAGLPFGVYHFWEGIYSPKVQAAAFLKLFESGQARPAEIYVDWERFYSGSYESIKDVVAFMETCEQKMGMEMGMYTGYYYFMEHTNTLAHFSQLAYLKKRKLWLAAYTDDHTNQGIMFVKIPRPWKSMNIWQYGTPSLGRYYGCTSIEIDMNERLDGFSPASPNQENTIEVTAGFGEKKIGYEEKTL